MSWLLKSRFAACGCPGQSHELGQEQSIQLCPSAHALPSLGLQVSFGVLRDSHASCRGLAAGGRGIGAVCCLLAVPAGLAGCQCLLVGWLPGEPSPTQYCPPSAHTRALGVRGSPPGPVGSLPGNASACRGLRHHWSPTPNSCVAVGSGEARPRAIDPTVCVRRLMSCPLWACKYLLWC